MKNIFCQPEGGGEMCLHSPDFIGLTIMTWIWCKGLWGWWMTDPPTFSTFAAGWACFLGQETTGLLVYWWAQLWKELNGEEVVVCNISQCSLNCHTNNYVTTGSSCGHANMPSLFSVAVFASLIAMENFWMGCSMINKSPMIWRVGMVVCLHRQFKLHDSE